MRVPGWLSEFWDRVVGSDPGLTRLSVAAGGAVSMASALALEYAFATVTHAGSQGIVIAMLLGAIVAMMGSMALTGSNVLNNVKTAVFFPVAIGLGMVIGVGVGGRTDLMLGVFVLVMFVAVFVRRFGLPFFFYGFMGWMGYFFAAFLHATWSMMPTLMADIVLGSAWVLLLSVTLLRGNPMRTLRRTIRAFDARARAVARAAADLLESAPAEPARANRARRRLRASQARLAEVALMVEAWSAEPGTLPAGWPAPALRRRLLDAQQTIDDVAFAAEALAAGNDRRLTGLTVPVLELLARHDDAGAERAAQALIEVADRTVPADPGEANTNVRWPSRQLAVAALEFVALARLADTPPEVTGADEFAPAVVLAMGNLPGSPAVAFGVAARGHHWNPLARLDLNTRQAIQVAVAGALAILAGRELSTARYYWAVIAAFVMFTGTGTRAETGIKGFNRVVGTLVGLGVSIWVADLTAGHTMFVLAAIVVSMFFGFYLVRLSYAYMIFFITIMVGQMYSVLHEFSDGLLVLRLEETSIGAAIGLAVALVVVPLSTRDTVRTARDAVLTDLSQVLGAAADRLDGTPVEQGGPDLDQLARGLDDRVRKLALVARPLTRPILLGNSPPRTRHRLSLYAATATHARSLTVGLRHHPEHMAGAACASRALAGAVQALAAPGQKQPALAQALAKADAALFAHTDHLVGNEATDPVTRPLIHLERLVRELSSPHHADSTGINGAGTPEDDDAVGLEVLAA